MKLIIQLLDKIEMPIQKAAGYIAEGFPGCPITHNLAEGTVTLVLDQEALTNEQRDWLHLSTFAANYIDSYEPKTAQEHQHTYNVAGGPATVRYCTTCPASWILDNSHGWHWVPVAENKPIDQGEQRSLVYRVENRIQDAIDTLAPIYKDATLNLVGVDLAEAMDSILDLRAMLGEE